MILVTLERSADGELEITRKAIFRFLTLFLNSQCASKHRQIFVVLGLVVSIILISLSLQRLSSTTYGVEYDKWAKRLDDATKLGGLHLGPIAYRFIKFPSTQISETVEDTCVSRDGLRVRFMVTYQYQMPAENLVAVVEKYKDYKSWGMVVEAAGYSAVQHSCSLFNITNFQTKRNLIQDAMFDNLRIKLEGSNETEPSFGVYARAVSLQLKNVDLPVAYKNAVSEKQSAEEDISLAKNERTQLVTIATTELLTAQEEAIKIKDRAMNDVNVTLTEAQLKANEITFAFGKETEVLTQAKANFGLDDNGVISYMSNQLYAKVDQLTVIAGEPAKISLKDEL